jgi:hypothetical protein
VFGGELAEREQPAKASSGRRHLGAGALDGLEAVGVTDARIGVTRYSFR